MRGLFLTIIIIFTNLYAQKDLHTVAVLDFDARGISQNETLILTNRLAVELGNTDALILVERYQLERILVEQGLQYYSTMNMVLYILLHASYSLKSVFNYGILSS